MGKRPFISHAVNGYSRYDTPENKAFSVTPGIIYPVRIQFVNARDRVTLHQGIDVLRILWEFHRLILMYFGCIGFGFLCNCIILKFSVTRSRALTN